MQSITPEIIFRGSKIMYCRVGKGLNIKILDSLIFLNMLLDKLPESFPLEVYDADHMNIEKCEQFLIWYENNKHKCFDFYEELLKYC